jgi:pyruvate/2-oxoglutarate dehydrogenase complex dihydrolipoamide acyltransferase (E2) component
MDILMPKWGMTMQEGDLLEWHVAVGDTVQEGQPLATVSTEKVDADIEAPSAGTVSELLVDAGDTVEVGTVIARLG